MVTGLENLGKFIIIVGVVLVLIGVAVMFASRVPGIGKLPGDILIRRDGLTFFFPIVSCLILSIVLTIVVNLIARLMR